MGILAWLAQHMEGDPGCKLGGWHPPLKKTNNVALCPTPRPHAASAHAQGAGAETSTMAAKKASGCKSALDLIASQMPSLPMHPVFQEIFNSPSLKGTFFVPTAKAWDSFFATVRQRQGNPEAPAMVARYGQVMLYHLAQDVNVPIATPTPGANKFAL